MLEKNWLSYDHFNWLNNYKRLDCREKIDSDSRIGIVPSLNAIWSLDWLYSYKKLDCWEKKLDCSMIAWFIYLSDHYLFLTWIVNLLLFSLKLHMTCKCVAFYSTTCHSFTFWPIWKYRKILLGEFNCLHVHSKGQIKEICFLFYG